MRLRVNLMLVNTRTGEDKGESGLQFKCTGKSTIEDKK